MEWQYSSSWRIHWIDDGKIYLIKKSQYNHLWTIVNCTPYGMVNQCHKDGYDLYHKGKKIAHGKTVKELKLIALEKEKK